MKRTLHQMDQPVAHKKIMKALGITIIGNNYCTVFIIILVDD